MSDNHKIHLSVFVLEQLLFVSSRERTSITIRQYKSQKSKANGPFGSITGERSSSESL